MIQRMTNDENVVLDQELECDKDLYFIDTII